MNKQSKGTILQFDENDHLLGTYSGELEEILLQIENAEEYYYRFPMFPEIGSNKKIRYSHFGLNGINVSSNYYNAEELLHQCLNYSIQTYFRKIRQNKEYHLSFDYPAFAYGMQLEAAEWLKHNDSEAFNERLDSFLNRHPEFVQVYDLNEYRALSGLYLLVLDNYNVCYIGQTQSSLMRRIKEHWTKNNYFQRGIDRFKSLDTTRIYVYPIKDVESINYAEYTLVPDFPEQYTLNCGSPGGDVYFMQRHKELKNIEPSNYRAWWREVNYFDLAEKRLGISKV